MTHISLYLCSRCKSKVTVANIKYDKNGKLVCVQCLGYGKAQEALKEIKKPVNPVVHYICMDCRYRFRIRRDVPNHICPYCGKSKLMNVKKYKDINDLIKASSDERYNF